MAPCQRLGMPRVLVVVNNDNVDEAEQIGASTTARIVSALKQAIALHSPAPVAVQVVTSAQLEVALSQQSQDSYLTTEDNIWCPLTVDVPDTLQFPTQAIYQACKHVLERRQWVQQHLGYEIGAGNF